jgi:predicted DNA-binding protein
MKRSFQAKRISVRFPSALQARLERRAKLAGKTESEIVREAVEAHIAQAPVAESALQLARRLGLVGCVTDAPSDLSTNSGHFEGFGASAPALKRVRAQEKKRAVSR